MTTAPIYNRPLIQIKQTKLNPDYWDTVLRVFDAGNFKESIVEVLKYVDPEVAAKCGNADQTEFVIPHGSSKIYLSVKDGSYSIKCPFLKVPEKNKVALLRQIAELNFNTLVLTQLVLNEKNELWFTYESPLELCEPYKVYYIFDEICLNADYFDDLYIEKFGAERLEPVVSKKLEPEVMAKSWDLFQAYLKEIRSYLSYFESKRSYSFCWDTMAEGFMKIDHTLSPQGYLRVEIEKAVNQMYANKQLPDILNDAKASLEKLEKFDRSKFEESIYEPDVFISARTRADITAVQNRLRKNYDAAKNEMGGSDYTGATLSLVSGIYELLYRCNVSSDILNIFLNAMEKASGLEWKQAAETLWPAVTQVMDMKPGEPFKS